MHAMPLQGQQRTRDEHASLISRSQQIDERGRWPLGLRRVV
jgi:hypothetical protein